MRDGWEAKLRSYEYFKFMTRIYCELIERGCSHIEACDELFYNGKG